MKFLRILTKGDHDLPSTDRHWSFRLLALALCLLAASCDKDDGTPRMLDQATCEEATSDLYFLPYPIGQAYTLTQGNCGSEHMDAERYAFDFAMPIGTIVTAARSGVVNLVEEGYADDDHEFDHVNQVVIEHDDGSFGRYRHLANKGVLVEEAQFIQRGDTIALSGNTGFSQSPHLHFDVIKCFATCADFQTVPIGFLNAEPPVEQDQVSYLAKDF